MSALAVCEAVCRWECLCVHMGSKCSTAPLCVEDTLSPCTHLRPNDSGLLEITELLREGSSENDWV